MGIETILLIAATVLGFYMAWNIGANDVANSMASAVGAKAITLKQAVVIASILNFVGAYFIGSHVTDTIRKGIVDPALVGDPKTIIAGALAALLSAGLWVTFSTWKRLPVSTTHSIVGAMFGFGLIAVGAHAINWGTIIKVVASWVISPVFAGLLAFFLFKFIAHSILSKENAGYRFKIVSPVFIFCTFMIVISSLLLKTNLGDKLALELVESLGYSAAIALTITIIYFLCIKRKEFKDVHDVEMLFRKIQILTSCYVAISIGANDVANAIGPVAAIYSAVKNWAITQTCTVPSFLLIVGGLGLAVGITTWGYRVIDTVGSKITELNNSRGFTIDFSAATSVLIASKLGMPVSTTHSVIGAVVGVGFARGLEAVDMSVVRKIIASWIFTLPVAALSTIPIYHLILAIWR